MIYHPQSHTVLYQDPVAQSAGVEIIPGLWAIPANVQGMQRAAGLDLPTVNPMTHSSAPYKWRGKYAPWENQVATAGFMVTHPRSLVLNDMGTGKTFSALSAVGYLMDLALVRRCLVVSPLSTIRKVWSDEIFSTFLGSRRFTVLHGSAADRVKKAKIDTDFYIVNHDGLKIGSKKGQRGLQLGPLAQILMEREDIDAVLVDEASKYRTHTSMNWRVLKKIVERKPYVWPMTGTPAPNAPTDAFALAALIKDLPFSFTHFQSMVQYSAAPHVWVDKPEAPHIVAKLLSPSIRYELADCHDLPPIVVSDREVPLTPHQVDAARDLSKNLQMQVSSGVIVNAVNQAVLRLKLLQISCGAVYGDERQIAEVDAKPRLDELFDVVDQAGGKVLIFCPFTNAVNLVYTFLRSKGVSTEMVTGSVSSGKRDKIFTAFQQGDLRCIAADARTMSHGLTLTACATMVWYAPVDDNETYQQAIARIRRPGQVQRQLVVRLSSTRTEQEMYSRLEAKQDMQGVIQTLIREKLS